MSDWRNVGVVPEVRREIPPEPPDYQEKLLSKAAQLMGRKGGLVKSERKTLANRIKAKLPRPKARGPRKP